MRNRLTFVYAHAFRVMHPRYSDTRLVALAIVILRSRFRGDPSFIEGENEKCVKGERYERERGPGNVGSRLLQ